MTLARALAPPWFAMTSDSASTLQKARALTQSQDYDGAIALPVPLLGSVTTKARAWLACGAARHGKR